MMIHFALSAVFGLIGAWLVHRFDLAVALLVGAFYGWVIYVVNFIFIAPAMFPWFQEARGAVSIFAHVVFGVVLTGSYIGLRATARQCASALGARYSAVASRCPAACGSAIARVQ